MFLTSIDPVDSGRLSPTVGNRHGFEPIMFKLDRFTKMQFRAKVDPDAEYSTPLKRRVEHKCLPADLARSCATMRASSLSRFRQCIS